RGPAGGGVERESSRLAREPNCWTPSNRCSGRMQAIRLAAVVLVAASCSSGATTPAAAPTSASVPASTTSSVASHSRTTIAPTTTTPPLPTTTPTLAPTTPVPPATTPSSLAAVVDDDVLAGISMTSVPPDVIVPTSQTSLDTATNPINGRRGGRHPLPEAVGCESCLTGVLDRLGFNVTGGSSDARERPIPRAQAVVHLDA